MSRTSKCCSLPSCNNPRTKVCSACLKEGYCSSECQKLDWKIHKVLCPLLKIDKLLSLSVVTNMINKLKQHEELTKNRTDTTIRVLEYVVTFAKYQYGERHQRNTSQIDHYFVEIIMILELVYNLADTYDYLATNMGNSNPQRLEYHEKSRYYYNQCLAILEPWRLQLESGVAIAMEHTTDSRVGEKKIERVDVIYAHLSNIKRSLGSSFIKISNFEEAEEKYDEGILYAHKIVEEGKRTEMLFNAMTSSGQNYQLFGMHSEAKIAYENAYNLVAIAHNPIHPMVLESADYLVDILIVTGDYHTAERYARISYECLTRPVDTQSEAVANSCESLARVLHKLVEHNQDGGDLKEAIILARNGLKIKEKIHGINHRCTANNLSTLSNVLLLNEEYSEEVLDLLERLLDIQMFTYEVDCHSIGVCNKDIAQLHHDMAKKLPLDSDARKEQLQKAEKYCKEAIRISSNVHGVAHEWTINYCTLLSDITEGMLSL